MKRKRWLSFSLLVLLLLFASTVLAKLDGLEMGDRIYDISLTSRNDTGGFPEAILL